MSRYFLDISYKGTQYAGWQVQPNAHTVQAELNQALATFFRKEVPTLGAGRTDSGVHASQLMVHIDIDQELPANFFHAINGILPWDVALNAVYRPVNQNLHARFDAMARAYIYHIELKKNPHRQEDALWVRQDIDISLMNEGAKILMEYEEFGSFCKAHADNHTNYCQIFHSFFLHDGHSLQYHVKANRFLRGMVRAIVGTLLLVGNGSLSLEGLRGVIEAQDRGKAGPNAAAKGLFLVEVSYPEAALTLIQS